MTKTLTPESIAVRPSFHSMTGRAAKKTEQNVDRIANFAQYPVAAFSGPDGNITLHHLAGFDQRRCDKLKAEGFSWLGIMGVMPDGSPGFVPNGVVSPAIAFAAALAYQQYVEALHVSASEPTYSWDLKKYLH